MRVSLEPSRSGRGFTLLEMSIVIMVLLSLMGTGLFVSSKYNDWKVGRDAGETLRTVYSAQRTFLADHPTRLVSSLTHNDIRPYLPGSVPGTPAAMPTLEALDGSTLQINVAASPPHAMTTGGSRYDPSGSFTDMMWDVGP